MRKHMKVGKLKHIVMALTMCGAVLTLSQLNANADVTTDVKNTNGNNAAENTSTTTNVAATQMTTVAKSTVNINTTAPVKDTDQMTTSAAMAASQGTDRGNYGWLDQASVSNGQLNVSGWNANGQAGDRPYHTIIVYDQTAKQELGRQTVQPVTRSDVAQNYPNVTNAVNSGWQASFKINSAAWLSHQLQLVSRYSFNQQANNTDADYWYAPISFDQNNDGSLDSWSFADGHLRASGWQATTASYNEPSHWLIVFDQTRGRELYRTKVTPVQRPDVAKHFARTYDSNQAGWSVDINFGNDSRWVSDQLQLVSRYSNDTSNGEGSHTDYWYRPIRADQVNRANLDQATIKNGKLNLAGWHATEGQVGRPNHFIIILGSNGQEIARTKVTNVHRPDVAQAYESLYDADLSGWSTQFDLQRTMVPGPIRIISRYSGSADGNSNYVDYWFAPVSFNANRGGITSISNQNGKILVKGYHFADAAYSQPYHYVILYDLTTNRQVAITKTTAEATPSGAPQVAAYNAQQAGFNAALTSAAGINSSHQYALVLRYSANPNGNGDESGRQVDAWLPFTNNNQGYLDSFNLADGTLRVTGWNANDFSIVAPYHYLIVYDNTAHRQVAAQLVNTTVERDDVARVYPKIVTADQAGFSHNFGRLSLQADHSYSVVSRYSIIGTGNGDNGAGSHQDIWLGPISLNQAAYSVDNVAQTANGIRVSGWMASDQYLNKPYAYVIGLYNGREFARSRVTFTSRPDVAAVYPTLYQSGKSGFMVNLPVATGQLKDGQLQFILRFAGDPAGNSNYTDMVSNKYGTNLGSARVSYNSTMNTISINGWHATFAAQNHPYQYLIVLGLDGHEFYRRLLNDTNSNEATMAGLHQAAWIGNAGRSGFSMTLPVTAAMNHRGIRIIHRYSNDQNGNGDYIDFYSPQIDINDGFQSLNGGTVYYDPINGQIVTGWRTINGNRYYFSDGYENQAMPDDLWVYNPNLHGQMYTGIQWVDGHCFDFGHNGVAHAQTWNDGWSWPFPASGEGYFMPGQRFGYSAYSGRKNNYHDGLDFGTSDHPGAAVHAVHGGKVLDINTVRNDKGQNMWWFILVYDGRSTFVYQEAFSGRNKIIVNRNDIIYPGQVIGYRDMSHLHLGINTSPNYGMDLAHSFQPSWSDASQPTGGGTWLNPEWMIRTRPY